MSVGICPWNFPVFVMARKLAPALVTGNTVVVKSSEVTPLTCARLAELWTASEDAAMPPKGTYSVITGLGSTVGASAKSVGSRRWREVLMMSAQVGAALVSSPLVDIVSMTGSVATGKAIMKSAAEHMTKVSLELGGKAPAIVCAGMDSVSRLRLATGAARRWRYRDGSVPRRRGPRPRREGHRGVAHLLQRPGLQLLRAGLRSRVDQGQVLE